MQELVLASASPRRAQLLRAIGLAFRVQPASIDETPGTGEPPRDYVTRMAASKSRAVARTLTAADDGEAPIVLGADTIVVLDGRILGKPNDREDGCAMLRALSGRRHVVMTAICAISGGIEQAATVTADVLFAELDAATVEAYWATGEGLDKAGSYGIQGIGGILVERLEGSYSAVVGLPLAETERALRALGMDTWRHRGSR